ncbi:MAG: hypothetical protein J3K34DRAFT_251035 [Monoraphidium minutum]|nr:MAG: hypothetical protein J3K34DRAFT_251035 [Monoraphidium minutum]
MRSLRPPGCSPARSQDARLFVRSVRSLGRCSAHAAPPVPPASGRRGARTALQRRVVAPRASGGGTAGAGSSRSSGSGSSSGSSTVISLDTGGQVEQLAVRLARTDSQVVRADLAFPMGLVFEARGGGGGGGGEGDPGGAADAAGIRPGDVLLASSAAMMRMTYPTAQLMFGGVGRPKLMRALVPAGSFPSAMDAVRSNKQLGDEITLFLERRGGGGGEGSGGSGGAEGGAAGGGGSGGATSEERREEQPASIFDSSLFDE